MNEKELNKHLNYTLYRRLCLDRTATPDLIKSTYRGLSKTEHPDISKHPEATEKFQLISFAYEILSKPDKKAKYDLILDQYNLKLKSDEKAKKVQEEQAKKREKAKEQIKTTSQTKPKQQVKQPLDISKIKKDSTLEFFEILNTELRGFMKEMAEIEKKYKK